jgi:ribonucleoside-diphosphate reductase alpha chain
MGESRTKSSVRHLARVLETGATLLDQGDAGTAPARTVNAHLAAIRTLGGDSEAAEAVCEAVRTRRATPVSPASLVEAGVSTAIEPGQLLPAIADATALASARAVATQAFVAVADALEALTIETDDQGRPTTSALIDAFRAGADAELVEIALCTPGGPRAAAITLRRQATGAREPGRQSYVLPAWTGIEAGEVASAIERVSRTRLAVRIGIGGGVSDVNAPAVALNVARYAATGDLPLLATDLAAISTMLPGCSVHLAGLAAAVMSQGLA